MKNVLKLIFSSLLVFPFTMNAQQQDFPVGTTPNEHNINGADYPRIGEDSALQNTRSQRPESRNQFPR